MSQLHEYSSDERRQLVRALESKEMLTLFFPLLKREEDEAIEAMVSGLQEGTEEGTARARTAAGSIGAIRRICELHDLAIELNEENEK